MNVFDCLNKGGWWGFLRSSDIQEGRKLVADGLAVERPGRRKDRPDAIEFRLVADLEN